MRWSEPQDAMLQAMGLRLWLPPAVGAAGPPGVESVAEAVAETTPEPATRTAAAPSPATAPAPAPRPAQPSAAVASPRPALPLASAAAAAAVATLDWPALRSAVADCRACSLCDSRRQTVFGVGHLRAHCMVVGEAPGEQEDASGEPFVGPSGQLLDRMLRALGLRRSPAVAADGSAATAADDPAHQVYIANTLKCRPPRNRNPSPQELATCQPFLQRQVALVQPRVILAMGRFAVQSLLGSDKPIGQLRGRLHHWHGVPLVVTYHPAYLLRQPADKARAWDDLCLAASVLDQARPAGQPAQR